MSIRDGEPIYFYELHEGDEDVFMDVLLAHDAEYDEAEFLELVLESRAAVLDHYEQDTLSEAIARDLAARYGFLIVDDSELRVAVNVSVTEGETFVVGVEEGAGSPGSPADDSDFRTLVLDVEPDDAAWGRD